MMNALSDKVCEPFKEHPIVRGQQASRIELGAVAHVRVSLDIIRGGCEGGKGILQVI